MISHKYRCIFVHQRKTAGTSVKALFDDFRAGSREAAQFNEGILDPEWEGSPFVGAYHAFTIIRNPWDRFVSGWKYCRSTRDRDIVDVLRNLPRENVTLKDVVVHATSRSAQKAYGRELFRKYKLITRHWVSLHAGSSILSKLGHDYRHVTRQQHETVVHPDGRLAVDRVIPFEELREGVDELCRFLGMRPCLLPHKNKTSSRDDYRSYFTDKALELFGNIFRKDIDLWGYDFETGTRKGRGSSVSTLRDTQQGGRDAACP